MNITKLNRYFSPAAVCDRAALFGRNEILDNVINIINEKSYHIIITGERGVGKSSLLKTADNEIKTINKDANSLYLDFKCTGYDDFQDICKELYSESHAQDHPQKFSPYNVVKMLNSRNISGHALIDEFEKAKPIDKEHIIQLCKHIGESGCKFTFCFCEAIDVPDEFYKSHHSIKRYVLRKQLSGISSTYTSEIVNNALKIDGLNPLNQELEAALYYVTQGIPFRIKELGKCIIATLLENKSTTTDNKLFKSAVELTLNQHYKAEHERLVNIFNNRNIGKICKKFLTTASNVSLNEFIDYGEIYKQLVIEIGERGITKDSYVQAISALLKNHSIIKLRPHGGDHKKVYFTDYSYPFIIRLLEQL